MGHVWSRKEAKMAEVSYIRLSSEDLACNPLLPSLVDCYRQVFADAPWNEWLKCPTCGTRKGIQEVNGKPVMCTDCAVQMIDFWPVDQVRQDILHEVGDMDAQCWLLVADEQVVGFCWGYPISLAQLAKKVELSLDLWMDQAGLTPETMVAYQDELGVLNAYRGQGHARNLVAKRMVDFEHAGLELGVMRTQTDPPTVTYHWYRRKGYEIVARYPEPDTRVLMAMKLSEFVP